MSTPPPPGGRDPVTGEPLSDKSGVIAGLLQLFLGCFGAGRFYLGSTSIGILQLCVGGFGLLSTLLGFTGLPFLLGAAVWGVADAIMIFTGSVRDRYGRKVHS